MQGSYLSSFNIGSIVAPRLENESTYSPVLEVTSAPQHLTPLPYIAEKEQFGLNKPNDKQRRFSITKEDLNSSSEERNRSNSSHEPQSLDSLNDIKDIITTANLKHMSLKLIEDNTLDALRSALQKEEDRRCYTTRLPVDSSTSKNGNQETDRYSDPAVLNDGLKDKKKARRKSTVIKNRSGSLYLEEGLDLSGHVYKEGGLSGSEDEESESSEEQQIQFKIDRDLTSFEQQKACISKLTSLNEQLALNTEKLLQNSSLQRDQLKEITKALNGLRKELSHVSAESNNIKIDLGNPRDWNAEYQKVWEQPATTIEQKLQKYQAIASLAQDFEYTAQLYGKIIITEVFLKNKYRTIRPFAEVGGNAGGEKFIYNGILFKFAVDWKGIYGSDHAAMKAAKHELLGLMAIHDANIEGVYTPLMCLIDYLGFRLVAISLLPDISKSSLIYGSDSAGLSVVASNAEFNKKMEQLGKKLNLAEHVAGRNVLKTKKLWMPVDIEGHLSKDGRFYLLDTARLMPPTYPEPSVRSCYLIRLFRPEYLRRYSKPLSSDACSTCFDMHEPNKAQHKADIKAATQELINKFIPSIVVWREKHAEELEVSILDVIGYLHAFGVNLRYLPAVRRATTSGSLRLSLLLEMTARGIKNHLLHLLREAKRTLGSMSEQSYRELLATACNKYLGEMNDKSTNDTWDQLRARLRTTFVDFPEDNELHNDLMEAPVKYQLAIEQGICPTIKWREPLIAPMQAWACKTCGIEEICGVCIKRCHKGHESGRCSISSGFVCACTIKCSHCEFIKSDVDYSKDLDGSLVHPLRYIITKMGMKKLFDRVSELTGIEFSTTALHVINTSRGFLTLSDIQGISVKIRKLPIVAIAEANNLALRAQLLENADERLSLLRQAIHLADSASSIYPSEQMLRFATELGLEAAFIAPREEASLYFFEVAKTYRVFGDKNSALKLLEQIEKRNLDVDSKIIDICLDLLMEPTAAAPLTRASLDILKHHGKHQHTLPLDSVPFVDDDTMKFIATYSGCSTLRIGFCTKVTDDGFCYMVRNIGKNLRELVIDGTNLTDASLHAIAKECHSLINLSMTTCDGFTDKGIKTLSKMPLLSRLNMKYCPNNPKLNIPSLQILLIAGTKITLKNLKLILKNCPALHTVDVSGCTGLDNVAEILPLLAKRAYSSLIAINGVLFNLNDKIMKQLSPKQILNWGQVRLISETLPDEFLQKLQEHNFTVLRNDLTIRVPAEKFSRVLDK